MTERVMLNEGSVVTAKIDSADFGPTLLEKKDYVLVTFKVPNNTVWCFGEYEIKAKTA